MNFHQKLAVYIVKNRLNMEVTSEEISDYMIKLFCKEVLDPRIKNYKKNDYVGYAARKDELEDIKKELENR